MKRFAQIVVLLSAYLVWVFGNAVIALSCHTNHDKHIYCCAKSCDCHHDGCEKMHFEAPHACNHDHSNRIVLYDISKRSTFNIGPVALCITTQISDDLRIEKMVSVRTSCYYERGVPLPLSPTLSRCGMRAPPVVV